MCLKNAFRKHVCACVAQFEYYFMKQQPSGLGVGFPIQESCVQNHWAAPRSTQPSTLPRSIKRVPGISGNLVIKSKLSPRSGSNLEAVEPHP